jgi:hypothetical protein
MTQAQKDNVKRFKAVQLEAKKLKAKNPKLKHINAVKQAWAILYSKVKKSAKKKVGAVKIVQKDKNEKVTKVLKQVRSKKTGQFKGYKQIAGVKRKKGISENSILNKIHKVKHDVERLDEAQHKHMIRKGSVGSLPMKYDDKEMARELQLFADNDYQLYNSSRRPILINLSKKFKKGTYNIEKSAKLWRYYIDKALMKYNKDFGSRGDKWFELLSVPDRNRLAMEYALDTYNEFLLGNFTEK